LIGLPKPIEQRLDRVVFRDHAPVGSGVLLGEFSELLDGPLDVVVLRQPAAVEERRVADDLGMDVFQPVVGQPELVVPHHRAVLQDDMRGAAGIVAKARQRQFLGDDIATEHRAALQHQAAIAGLGQIGRRHQAVVARARHDDVEPIGHSRSIPRIIMAGIIMAGQPGPAMTLPAK
jgi:hypothetical protein